MKAAPGVDQIAQGMGGLMSITGLPGQGPVRVGIAINDTSAGLLLANGITLALLARERSGEGQWVHTSLLEAQIFMLDFQASRYTMKGEIARQEGNFHPTSPGTGMFQTADGYINIAASGDNLWKRFCEVAGDRELAGNPDFATVPLRAKNRAGADRPPQRSRALEAQRLLGRDLEQGRRAVRPDQHDRPDLCRPAGQASQDPPAGRSPQARHLRHRRPGDPHERARRSPSGCARPPTRASTPTRSCASWATMRRRSPRCMPRVWFRVTTEARRARSTRCHCER